MDPKILRSFSTTRRAFAQDVEMCFIVLDIQRAHIFVYYCQAKGFYSKSRSSYNITEIQGSVPWAVDMRDARRKLTVFLSRPQSMQRILQTIFEAFP